MSFRNYLLADKVPMHPEDFAPLLEWVWAKEKGGGEE
jgi:hypothetical protein